MAALSNEASESAEESTAGVGGQVRPAPQNPQSFQEYKHEYIRQNDIISHQLEELTENETVTKLKTLFAIHPDNENIPPSEIEQNIDIKTGLKEQHQARMRLIDTLAKDATMNQEVVTRLKAEAEALYSLSLNYIQGRQDFLNQTFADPDAQQVLLNAYKSESGLSTCTFQEMINSANTTGIKFKYGERAAELTIQKGESGELEFRSSDPKSIVDAAASCGLTSLRILEGTTTSMATAIIVECNKRGIRVKNPDYVGEDSLFRKFSEIITTTHYSKVPKSLWESRGAKQHADYKNAALLNSMIFMNGNYPNSDGSVSKNMVFSDFTNPPKDQREVINVLKAMSNGAKPDAIRSWIGGKDAKWLAEFLTKAEPIISTVNNDTGRNEFKVPDGGVPAKLVDIQEYVRDVLLVNDKKKYEAVYQSSSLLDRRVEPKAEVEPAAPALGQSRTG